MAASLIPPASEGRLHPRITAQLALRVIESDRQGRIVAFPREAELCEQLGVSRSILRESMKVLVDKGMVEMKPKAGTRSKPRSQWRRLDSDILGWQASLAPDPQFIRDLCEVRLAIEPTAAGFAAVRATDAELAAIESCLAQRREAADLPYPATLIDLDMAFQSAVVGAAHNDLLTHLCASIRGPFRVALSMTSTLPSSVRLGLEAHEVLVKSLRTHDPMGARRAAEDVVGLAMLAVESGLRRLERQRKPERQGRKDKR